jgi:hypothetical protein
MLDSADTALNKNDALDILFAAQELGYCVWSEELGGRHGRDWKPDLDKAA